MKPMILSLFLTLPLTVPPPSHLTQAPTGACLLDTDKILVCDTLNNKIKCVEVDGTRSANSKTFIGSGKRGNKLNQDASDKSNKNDQNVDTNGKENGKKEESLRNLELNSPQGVAYDRNKRIIYIADTGNNRILRIDRVTSNVSEIKLDFTKI